jgi:hypothetical protein
MATTIQDYHFTILHGIRVRSGTNYLSKLLSCHPAIQLVPPRKTTDEFPFLATTNKWQTAFSSFVAKFNGDRSQFNFDDFAPFLGDAWLAYIIQTFQLQPGHVFVKDPRVYHLHQFFKLFPRAKLIILIRDGRDNVASCMKAGLALRKSLSFQQKLARRVNHTIGRDFINHTRAWVHSAYLIADFDQTFKDTEHGSKYLILRYENMFQEPRPNSQRLFDFIGLDLTAGILNEIENLDVVGSSFYSPSLREDAHKPNWTPSAKTAAFQPVGRWRKWNKLQKYLFKRLAGQALIEFDYEQDLNW